MLIIESRIVISNFFKREFTNYFSQVLRINAEVIQSNVIIKLLVIIIFLVIL